jgi:hypothetical protein
MYHSGPGENAEPADRRNPIVKVGGWNLELGRKYEQLVDNSARDS